MRKSRFTEEKIIAVLTEQERGTGTAEVCRKHGISPTTFYKWKAKFGMRAPRGTLNFCSFRSDADSVIATQLGVRLLRNMRPAKAQDFWSA
jgi:transposase-like protein